MPQMSPMLWLNLMMVFLVGIVLFISFTYFLKAFSNMEEKVPSKLINQKNWNW